MAAPTPKKVVIYTHSWLPRQTDGVGVRFLAHVKELVRKGVQVTLVTPDFLPAKSRGDFVVVEGVRHILLDTTFTPGYKQNKGGIAVMCAKSSISNLKTLVEVLREVQPDVVHMAQCASMVMVSCACLMVGVPLVMSVHTDIRASSATTTAIAGSISDFGLLLAWLVGGTFFPVSGVGQGVLENAGVGGTQGLVRWGPMVDNEVFRIDRDAAQVAKERSRLTHGDPKRFLITYVGRFSLEKEVLFLIEAVKRAPANVTLALVGDGPLAPDFAKAAKELAPKVWCEPKFVGRDEVALALAASDVGVSASRMETCGFCAIESIACGTPFLAADALGFHEHLTQGKNARLWEPGSTQSFDEALLKFVAEKEAKQSWDKAALSESVHHARLADCTERALEAYTHRLHRPLLARLLLVPITAVAFLYNSVGEQLFAPDFPPALRGIFAVPIWGCMGMVLPTARTFQPICSSRFSMAALLSASVLGCSYATFRVGSFGSKSIIDRLSR